MAPVIPTQLSVAYKSDQTIKLTWKANDISDGGVTYQVERDGILFATTGMNTFFDTSLQAGKSYSYRVRAYDSVGNFSGYTNFLTVTTMVSASKEFTIYYKSGFATPSIQYRIDNGTWSALPGMMMSPAEVDGYFKITIPAGSATNLEACFTNGSNLVDCNNGLNYKINSGVFTIESTGIDVPGKIVIGAPSNKITTPVGGDFTAPTKPGTPTEMEIGYNYIALKWTASVDDTAVSSYLIYRDGVKIAEIKSNQYTDIGLQLDTYYSYRIKAVDIAGNQSRYSNGITRKTKDL